MWCTVKIKSQKNDKSESAVHLLFEVRLRQAPNAAKFLHAWNGEKLIGKFFSEILGAQIFTEILDNFFIINIQLLLLHYYRVYHKFFHLFCNFSFSTFFGCPWYSFFSSGAIPSDVAENFEKGNKIIQFPWQSINRFILCNIKVKNNSFQSFIHLIRNFNLNLII